MTPAVALRGTATGPWAGEAAKRITSGPAATPYRHAPAPAAPSPAGQRTTAPFTQGSADNPSLCRGEGDQNRFGLRMQIWPLRGKNRAKHPPTQWLAGLHCQTSTCCCVTGNCFPNLRLRIHMFRDGVPLVKYLTTLFALRVLRSRNPHLLFPAFHQYRI